MKSRSEIWSVCSIGLLSMSCAVLGKEPGEPTTKTEIKTVIAKADEAPAETEVAIEAAADDEVSRQDWPYLGIATMEASDTLAAQLGLRPGTGVVITYVAPDSPAARAG